MQATAAQTIYAQRREITSVIERSNNHADGFTARRSVIYERVRNMRKRIIFITNDEAKEDEFILPLRRRLLFLPYDESTTHIS